jgi:lysophospholipase L1-like esterase
MNQREPIKDKTNNDNWFAKNPKKTLFFLLFVLICLLIFATEKILEYTSSTHVSGIKRSIRLREYEPLLVRYQHHYDPSCKVYDSFIEKDYWLRIDRDGFIIPSKIHDNPDLKIIFLGASTTECTWVDQENKFPYVVGRLAEKDLGIKVNSYNASKAGNTTIHSLNILLNKLIPLNPDIVVMMHNINDLSTLFFEKTYWNKNRYRSTIVEEKDTVMGKLKDIRELIIPYFYAGIKDVIRTVKGKSQTDEFESSRKEKATFDKAYLLKEFRLNLETFISLCRIRNISPVLMTQMNRLQENTDNVDYKPNNEVSGFCVVNSKDFREMFHLFNQEIRNVGAQYGITVIDLAKDIPGNKEYLFDAVHLTDKGSIMAADIIYGDLKPLIKNIKTK